MLRAALVVDLRCLAGMALAASIGCTGRSSSAPEGGVRGDGATLPEAPSTSGASGAGPAYPGCLNGSVTFVLDTAAGTTGPYCVERVGSCTSQWLDITNGSGFTLAIQPRCCACGGSCGVCGSNQPVCPAPGRLPDGGIQIQWDGTYSGFYSNTFSGLNFGTQDNFSCHQCAEGAYCPPCAPAGTYLAVACGYEDSADASGDAACTRSFPTAFETASAYKCGQAMFTWPPEAGSAPIHIVLNPPGLDAGSCCPLSWNLSDCNLADGGVGQYCLDPARYCTSPTCGETCNPIPRCDGG